MMEVIALFGRLGILGFGGPIAAIAMMEEETCRTRKWVTPERFAQTYAVCKLLPGPFAVQMSIYLGSVRAGILGGILAGSMFILPAFLLVLALSYLYIHYGSVYGQGNPRVALAFAGLQAGALAVILMSSLQLGQPYRRDRRAWVIGALGAFLIGFLPRAEPLIILLFGGIGILVSWRGTPLAPPSKNSRLHAIAISLASVGALARSRLGEIFWVCFKAGAFVFGSGLAIVPMLEGDSVRHFHWLTHSQFMDGLAIGQITPGPVTITATFIGYLAGGLRGAGVATLGMYLPSFINVLFLLPRTWARFVGTPAADGFSAWAIPVVIGGIIGTSFRLGWLTIRGPIPLAVLAVSLVLAFRYRPPAWILIPGAGMLAALVGFL